MKIMILSVAALAIVLGASQSEKIVVVQLSGTEKFRTDYLEK